MFASRGWLVALALGVPFQGPARASEFSPAQADEVRSILRSYMVEHPEVIREAMGVLEARDKAAAAQAARANLLDARQAIYGSPDSIVVGNPQGRVTLVEWFDYNCGFCRRALGDMDRLMRDNKDLRVVLRDFPILSPQSTQAAVVALAVHEQLQGDAFWEFHRRLLSTDGVVGREQALAVAAALGADMGRLKSYAARPDVEAVVHKTVELATGLGMQGTPAYVIEDVVVDGAVGYDALNGRIANVRKCGRSECP